MSVSLPSLDAARARLAGATLAFVGGQGKSGTTWVEKLIDAHPQAACLGEGHFAEGLGRALYQALDTYNRQVRGNNARFPELEDFPTLSRDDALDLARAALLLQFARIAARNPAASVVAVRTPSELNWLRELADTFPDARFVHVLRDPRDVALSLWAHGERLEPGRMTGQHGDATRLAFDLVPRWARHVAHVRGTARDTGVALHELRYEALSSDPRATAGALFRFLGLRADEATLAACIDAASFARLSGRSVGNTDTGSHFRRGSAGEWRAALPSAPPGGWPAETCQVLESLEYPVR